MQRPTFCSLMSRLLEGGPGGWGGEWHKDALSQTRLAVFSLSHAENNQTEPQLLPEAIRLSLTTPPSLPWLDTCEERPRACVSARARACNPRMLRARVCACTCARSVNTLGKNWRLHLTQKGAVLTQLEPRRLCQHRSIITRRRATSGQSMQAVKITVTVLNTSQCIQLPPRGWKT